MAKPLAELMVQIFPDLRTYETCRSSEDRTLLLPIWFNSFQYDEDKVAQDQARLSWKELALRYWRGAHEEDQEAAAGK